jgi:hypothetical protein
VNFNNGDVTLTHTSNTLTVAGGTLKATIKSSSINAPSASDGLNITFDGSSTKNKITLTDNLADALNITEGIQGPSYMKFTTTNSSELITITPLLELTNGLSIGGTAVNTTATELNILDESSVSKTALASEASTGDDAVLAYDHSANTISWKTLATVCFLKGTKITLSDNSQISIEDLTLDNDVLTYSINEFDTKLSKENIVKWSKDNITGNFSKSGIRNIWITPTDSYLVINEKLNVTPGHIMFYRRNNKYYFSHAIKLQINDELFTTYGKYEKIHKIKCIQEELNVYNFEVDQDSTYFADNYLVHHMCELCSGYANII